MIAIVIKRLRNKEVCRKIPRFNDYKDCLLNNEIMLKSQQIFKSEAHNLYTEKVNKVALSSNDDKRLRTFDIIYRLLIKLHHILMEQVLGKYVKQRC